MFSGVLDIFVGLSIFSVTAYYIYQNQERYNKLKMRGDIMKENISYLNDRIKVLEETVGIVSHVHVPITSSQVPQILSSSVQVPTPVPQVPLPQILSEQVPKNIEVPQEPIPENKIVRPIHINVTVPDSDSESDESSDDEPPSLERDVTEEIDIINSLKKFEGELFKDFMVAVDNKKLKYRVLRVDGKLAVDPENLTYDRDTVGVFIVVGGTEKIVEKIVDVGGIKI